MGHTGCTNKGAGADRPGWSPGPPPRLPVCKWGELNLLHGVETRAHSYETP